jgi:hypothetical protein
MYYSVEELHEVAVLKGFRLRGSNWNKFQDG